MIEASTQSAAETSGWALGLELPPELTVSQWADEHRHIAAGTGPEPGRWSTDRTPYAREPMDVVNDPDVEIVVLKWSSQVAKTEVLINVCGYYIAQDPSPQMFVLPDLGLADSFSRNRFTPTIEATPELLARIGRTRSRDSNTTILEKAYPGGDIVFAGANSPASLASRPRRIVAFDEIDKYKAAIGNDGDPIKQGFQRTQNFRNRKKLLASTPTIEGASAIDEWFKRSDQRYFEVPCHVCGTFQSLEWEQVRWTKKQPETAHYCCAHCEAKWEQADVYRAVRKGHWRARADFNGIAGFHIWAIYSPWVSMIELVEEWEDCEDKPGEEQTFVNLKLGRCYNPTKKSRTTPKELFNRKGDFGPIDGSYTVPEGVLLVTVGIDVQSDRFEIQYLGWGVDETRWVLDYFVHYDDPTDKQSFVRMEEAALHRVFKHPRGGDLFIEAVAIDAGYLQQDVLEFVREARAAWKPFYATKGKDGHGRPIIIESDEKFKRGAKLYIVGVDDGKTHTYASLAARPDEDGKGSYRVHFARHLEMGYFEQLVSERVKIEYVAGRPVRKWVLPSGKRNEALDTFVLAMAARFALPGIDYHARAAARAGDTKKVDGAFLASLMKR